MVVSPPCGCWEPNSDPSLRMALESHLSSPAFGVCFLFFWGGHFILSINTCFLKDAKLCWKIFRKKKFFSSGISSEKMSALWGRQALLVLVPEDAPFDSLI